MNLKTLLLLSALTASIFALTSKPAIAQATPVNDAGATYIYVNAATGSDSNVGTSAKPFKTIQAGINRALALNRLGHATWVMMYPGVYREAISISGVQTGVPMTIASVTAGTVYIDGTNILTGGYAGAPGVYDYHWEDTVTGCPLPNNWYTGMPPVVMANEMVLVNGSSMTQVMSAAQLVAGTFYINQSSEVVEVYPPSGTNMSTAQVEVSARRATLTVNDSKNLVFRGLIFQHAASCINVAGANVYSSSNILFNQIQANWNNWGGLEISNSSAITVENSTASNNGGVGLGAFQVKNALYASNETDYNNWRGEMVGLYDFASGGTKIMHAHTITVSGQISYNNEAQGLWFDTDNMNVTVDNAILAGSLVDNLQLEANQGPITVENSSFCSGGTGVNIINSAGLTFTGNNFYNNGNTIGNLVADQNAQIFLAGQSGGRIVSNFETGQETNVYTTGTKVESNSFSAVGSGQYVFNTYLSGNDWPAFVNSGYLSNNKWYDNGTTTPFGLPGGKRTNLAGWKNTVNDPTSSWTLSSTATNNCSVPAAAYSDFNVLAHNAVSYVSGYKMSAGKLAIPIQVRSFGYGTVRLSASGVPSNVAASFSPATLVSGNSTLTLTANSSATPQTVLITVFASSGSRVHTVSLWVTISRP